MKRAQLLFIALGMAFGLHAQDPGTTIGNTGTISFTYRGTSVTYPSVRAADGKIWLNKNLGATQIATYAADTAGYGDLFQWGRWDDGHQLRTSTNVLYNTIIPNNPSGLGTGNVNYVRGTVGTSWWQNGDTSIRWSGTAISATNGKDPCTALGTGWRMPTIDEWTAVLVGEGVADTGTAMVSRLKLPATGFRYWFNNNFFAGVGSTAHYWSSSFGLYGRPAGPLIEPTALTNSYSTVHGAGNPCRCVKIVTPTTSCSGVPAAPYIVTPTSGATPPSICANSTISLTAADPNAAMVTGVTYQWQTATAATGPWTNVTGAGAATLAYTTGPLSVTSYFRIVSTCTVSSQSVASANKMIVVTPLVTPTAAITVSPAGAICPGVPVTFTATSTNGGTTPAYQWKKGTANVGTGGTTYTYIPANGDTITAVLTSNAVCPTATSATSNAIIMNVLATVTPTVTITPSIPNPVCQGVPVTFTAVATDTGSAPGYQWQLNNSNVATTRTYTLTPTNTDIVKLILTSNAACANPTTAQSNSVVLNVTPSVIPGVSITASPAGPVCAGTMVTYTAVDSNGGTIPMRQWKKNNTATDTGLVYAITPSNGDIITFSLTSNANCATPITATANTITAVVNPLPTKPVVTFVNNTLTVTGTYTSYQWYINGSPIPGATGASYTPPQAAAYVVTVTDANGCSNSSDPTTANLAVNMVKGAGVVRIHPNPATSIITIETAMSKFSVSISSVDGRTMISGMNSKTIDISNLPTGVYTIRIANEEGHLIRVEQLVKANN